METYLNKRIVSMRTAIVNAKVFTGEKIINNAIIVVENGRICAIENSIPADARVVDLQGWNIAPGLIDIQINGGATHYFTQSPDEDTLHDICDTSMEFGTTHVLPCLISSSHENILKAIESVKSFMDRYIKGVIGMHLEGPFLNPLKKGAHNKSLIRKPSNKELEEIIHYGKNVIKVMTIAPECFTEEQIEMLVASGIVLSAGHSEMTYQQAQHYFDKGITLVTHLYNAMTQMGHRQPGIVGAVFDNEDVFAPIILDGAHCHYAVARIAYKIKRDKLFLITDSSFLGRKLKEFEWEFINAKLIDGFYRNNEGNLAGASISMVEAVQNAIQHLNVTVEEALCMATFRVAKALQMDHEIGAIKVGYPARFIKFTNDFKQYETLVF